MSAVLAAKYGPKLIAAAAWTLAVAVVLGGLLGVGYGIAAHRYRPQIHALEAEVRGIRDQLAEATKAQKAKADAASQQAQAERRQADEELERARAEADRLRGDLAAAIRAGRVQLRPEWAGVCPANAGQAATASAAADAERRADGAGRVVAAGADDAAVMRSLWAGWKAEHEAVIAAGCAVEVRP